MPRLPKPWLRHILATMAALMLLATACTAKPAPTDTPMPAVAEPTATATPVTTPTPEPDVVALWQAVASLKRAYIDTGQTPLTTMVQGGVQGLAAIAGTSEADLSATAQAFPDAPPPTVPQGFEDLWRAWKVVRQKKPALPAVDVTTAAVNGMIKVTGDVAAMALPGGQLDDANEYFQGAYKGIGALVSTVDGKVTITQVFPQGPADRAGVMAKDVVIAVDGESVEGMALEDVVARTRGPDGSIVTLRVLRAGRQLDLPATRGEVQVPSVSATLLPSDIGYIAILRFTDRTGKEFIDALTELRGAGAVGLVLDLRNNPGGSMGSAATVISQFVDHGLAYYEIDIDGKRIDWKVEPGGLALDLPTVVIVNHDTLSAAEAVMGALQDNQRARVFGVTTYGKGTLLVLKETSAGFGLYVLAGHWYTPNGRSAQGTGLAPDETVVITATDIRLTRDRQLLTAYFYMQGLLQAPKPRPTPVAA